MNYLVENLSTSGYLPWAVRPRGTSSETCIARFEDEDDARMFALVRSQAESITPALDAEEQG